LRYVLALLVVALGVTVGGRASAVDGFSQPTYSPNSNPTIHQTEACSGLNGTVCSRWVRQGGTYMQGPHSQMDAETPLIAIKCSNGARVSGVWNWMAIFNENTTGHEFCEFGSPDFWRRS
jgi:hypothetical protein